MRSFLKMGVMGLAAAGWLVGCAHGGTETHGAAPATAQASNPAEPGSGAQLPSSPVEGQLSIVSDDQVVVVDKNHRSVNLMVTPKTEVTLDGKSIKAGDLPPGADVRASFDQAPAGQQASATKIEAKSVKPSK